MVAGLLDKGVTLAGYRIDGVLGQGGMGAVYEATQLSLERVVALKVLAPNLSADPSFIERFRREGQIQAAIDHPHIVTVYDSGQSERGFYIAMRLVRGPNLKDMIVARQLDPGRTLRIVTPVASALDTAHAAGLIHRDIKPQNILVGGRDHAYLADFGLTKAPGDKSLTRTGQFVGTLDYISPEQIKGERASNESDVYALAAVIYECLTGVVPYPKDSEAAVLYAHMADEPPAVTETRPDLPAALDGVLATAMAKEPAQRYSSASELLHAINRAFTRRQRAAFTPPGPIEVPEETGIRQAEVDVPTREADQPQTEGEETGPPETVIGAQADETAAPPPPEETRPAAQPAEAAEAEPGDTAVGAAPQETAAGAPATQVGAPGQETELGPAETRLGAKHPETELGPAETRLGAKHPETEPGLGPTRRGTPPTGPRPPTPATAPAAPAAGPTSPSVGARRRAPAGILAGLAAAVIAAIVVGFLLGQSGSSDETEPAGTRAVNAGALRLDVPTPWRPMASPPEIPGLELDAPLALSPGGGGALMVGFATPAGPSLLPASFLDALGSPPARDDAVRLGDLEAYRYADLRPEGFAGRVTVYAASTSNGAATVACSALAGTEAGFLRRCEEIATTLELTNGDAFPLGPDAEYADQVDAVIRDLNAARAKGTRRLRQARRSRGQAEAARAIADAYGAAARRLRGATDNPVVSGANSRLVQALGDGRAAYDALASAARRERRGAYASGRERVRRADARVQRALRAVRAANR